MGWVAAAAAVVGAASSVAGAMKKPKTPDTSAQEAVLARQERAATDEKNRLASEQLAKSRASRRGGFRGLLSETRLNPETGLSSTLGPEA